MSMTVTGTTTARSIVNTFDYMGLLLTTPRLPGERNPEYRKRLLDVYVNRAGSHELGLVNGMTRELGLEKFNALDVSFVGPPGTNPRIAVRDTEIELYSDWRYEDSYTLDEVLDIYTRGAGGYYLAELVDLINATGTFAASLATGANPYSLSRSIYNQDSVTRVHAESIKQFKRSTLEHQNILPGSERFSEVGAKVFALRVVTESSVTRPGTYYVDYTNGILVSYSLPVNGISASYYYTEVPMTLQASPVILHEFGSDVFRDKVFQQILQDDGTYIDGLPNEEATDYILELLKVKGTLWGR